MGKDSMRLLFARAKEACQVDSAAAIRKYHCSMVNKRGHHLVTGVAIL